MRSLLTLLAVIAISNVFIAQNNPYGQIDPHEIRYYSGKPYNKVSQQQLRTNPAWQHFLDQHGTWYVHFNENTGMPHRAYGKPFQVAGNTAEEKALAFAATELASFGVPTSELVSFGKEVNGKHTWANFRQYHEGLQVLDSRYSVKFDEGRIIMFGCDIFPVIDLNTTPTYSGDDAALLATNGISNSVLTTMTSSSMKILPVPVSGKVYFHLVYDVMVRTESSDGIPANYQTYVDAHTGQVLSRRNTVYHFAPLKPKQPKGQPAKRKPESEDVLAVTATVSGLVYENNPFETAVTQGLENIYVTVGSTNHQADQDGSLTVPVNPGSTATVRLMGPWCRVYTDGVTPLLTTTLAEGQNNISLDNYSNIKERSAYRSVQTIHDFQQIWMPEDFTEMDFQLETNIDVAGTCNAFYDGNSINFYDIGGGCNASSLVADVCHHEYGHGINDNFYQSLGGAFINGAMDEGYADFWALSANDDSMLGVGFNTDNLDPIRRYDIDPKVYPSDISGEVHGDGEIIMGAWYDTHLLMGSDWNITMPLFIEAYNGLQAQTPAGNEGEAYTDVLIDLLQADDNDGDITNGTPNGDAIIEGFYIHGITLVSNAELTTDPIEFIGSNIPLELETQLDLQFPFTQYLNDVQCFYQINNEDWLAADMVTDNEEDYTFDLPGQAAATVVAYYFGVHDLNGSISGVIPIGAHLDPFPNLPFFTLVGVQEIASHDSDEHADFGNWQTGLPGDDASTGEWDEASPIGSATTDAAPGTIVQTNVQHTEDGEFCFVTGNATNASSGIGENDVDDGKTTLQTPIIDMSELIDPVVAYWRWYTNSPPGGANPGQDYWQVRMSNNGGQTWTYIENNMTSDLSWRRNAFRVADYLTPTDEMRFQFIASDSLHIGQNLDGGSLVEAAVDDFVLYDKLVTSVDEQSNIRYFTIFPNPAEDEIMIRVISSRPGDGHISLINSLGKLVLKEKVVFTGQTQQLSLILSDVAPGIYSVVISSEGMTNTEKLVVK